MKADSNEHYINYYNYAYLITYILIWFMGCWGTHAVDANAETFNISPSGIQSLIGVI